MNVRIGARVKVTSGNSMVLGPLAGIEGFVTGHFMDTAWKVRIDHSYLDARNISYVWDTVIIAARCLMVVLPSGMVPVPWDSCLWKPSHYRRQP